MIVCPLCEHPQAAGDACENCGRPFPAGLALPVEVPPTEGLEPTAHLPVPVDAPVIPDLEPTHHEATLAMPETVEGLEPTRAEATGAVASEVIPELERIGDGIPEDEATPFPAVVTCRYCRNPAAPGERLCGHCGMRLPTVAPAGRTAAAGGEGARICGCGMVVRGGVCPSCGARA